MAAVVCSLGLTAGAVTLGAPQANAYTVIEQAVFSEATLLGVPVNGLSTAGCPQNANGTWPMGCSDGQGIWVNTTTTANRVTTEAEARDIVRHEVAHVYITRTCGTWSPELAGARGENVTDAYAVKYFGMSTAHAYYGFTTDDTAVATKIRQGQCTTGNPTGNYEYAAGGIGQFSVSGWAYDPDAPNDLIQIHVYIGGPYTDPNAQGFAITTGQSRPDVFEKVGSAGTRTGFSASLATSKRGTLPVYVYAINKAGTGDNVLLGTRTVTIQ